jgi:hypothetical protein
MHNGDFVDGIRVESWEESFKDVFKVTANSWMEWGSRQTEFGRFLSLKKKIRI